MSELRVSVVIPTCDRDDLLQVTLDSVLNQSFTPTEIILVDNGRSDAHYRADERIVVVRTAPRIGPSKARNIGAKAATGDLVAFLDDDDQWQFDYLENIIRCFKEHTADAVLGRLMRRAEGSEARPYKEFPFNIEDQRKVFFSNPGFGGQNLTIRRDTFLELGGFDETMPASEDRDLAARMILARKKIVPALNAVAILCDHQGPRARNSLLKGNWAFIKKHWRNMRAGELYQALKIFVKRYFLLLLGR
jgi:GT2 family glycosyltransferase